MVTNHWLLQPTSPTSEPPYQPSDTTRSTSDFITTSLLTLFLCVWTTIHSNIPLSTRRKETGALWWDKLRYAWLAMVTPERVLYGAFRQFWEASVVCRVLKEIEREKGSTEKAGDVEKGEGVDVSCADQNTNNSATAGATEEEEGKQRSWEQTRPVTDWRKKWKDLFPDNLEIGFFLTMGGIEVVRKQDPTQRRQLTPRGVVHLARAHLLPSLSLDEINDKSKSDGLAKLLACAQASWFIVQSIARMIYHYPLSLLEIHILTHVICTLGMYLLWLKKPQNVLVTTIVPLDEPSILLLVNKPGDFTRGESKYLIPWDPRCIVVDTTNQGSLVDVPDRSRFLDISRRDLIKWPFVIAVCAAYGAVHLIPWHAHFPTHLERIMWRVSAVTILGYPTLGLLFSIVLYPTLRPLLIENGFVSVFTLGVPVRRRRTVVETEQQAGRRKRSIVWVLQLCVWVIWVLVTILGAAFMAARLFLLVESFASLRSLEVGTWKNVGWLGAIPHL